MIKLNQLSWKTAGGPVAAFAYGVSATGQRTNCVETVNGSARSYMWQYDVLRRLTNELISVGGGSPGSVGYQLDGVGNRSQRSSSLPSIPSQSLSYSSNDWVRGDGYDNNGNTQSSGAVTYQYDYANRLTNAGVIQFTYDAEGNRVSKTSAGVTTLYLVDEHNPTGYPQVVEESTVQGGVTNLARVYTYGLSVISQRQGSTVYFLGADGHGSTRFLMNGSGRVINTFAYDSYGNLISSSATPQTAYLYCGEQWDADLGMYYLRARYYKPDTGRFWTMDTFQGSSEDPLSLHRYTYCANDPVNAADPMGLLTQSFGYLVEPIIQSVYASDHAGDVVAYGQWTRIGGLTGNLFKLKPDIFNTTTKRWAEIKPFTTSGIAKAGIQFTKYLGFAPFGYFPDVG